jgi:large subunit ribosomal protein L28
MNPFSQICQFRRFTTSLPLSKTFFHVVNRKQRRVPEIKVGDPISRLLARPKPKVPPYPYGESNIYKQSNRGLYGGKFIFTGHHISEFKNKHLRFIKPNVQRHKLWSETLNTRIRCRVVNSVLKTITKEGGLDNYLIKDRPSRIKALGPYGWALRYRVLTTMEAKEKWTQKSAERQQRRQQREQTKQNVEPESLENGARVVESG